MAERPKGLRWSAFSEEPGGAAALDGWITHFARDPDRALSCWITRHTPRDPDRETTPANRKPQSAFADSGIFFLTFL